MAVVTTAVAPERTYHPFEGMSEAQRLVTAVPRGLIRFTVSAGVVDIKPVNDQLRLINTCSLPEGFAYVLASLSWQVIIPRATDWHPQCQTVLFNGAPGAPTPNNQVALFDFTTMAPQTTLQPSRKILEYGRGGVREWYSGPIVGAPAVAFVCTAFNPTATVDIAGTQDFNLSFYQYELNQAVRFPLNFPLPVGIR